MLANGKIIKGAVDWYRGLGTLQNQGNKEKCVRLSQYGLGGLCVNNMA